MRHKIIEKVIWSVQFSTNIKAVECTNDNDDDGDGAAAVDAYGVVVVV